ncbi:hypothetical protein ACU4GD_21630 [Cupriavidus basilensis]
MHWLADHGMTEAAARHALASGQRETAYGLAQRCLHEGGDPRSVVSRARMAQMAA